MIVCPSSEALVWGQRWRSSPAFIVAAMGMALFTDMFLYTLIVPILPYMSEVRLGLDATYTQRMFFALLSQSALVSVILSPIIGHFADKTSTKRAWLLYALVVVLGGSIAVALATSAVVLFAGRLIQAMASSVMWVVGFSTIAGNVKAEHLGKTYGIVSVAIAMGTSAGPMVSGILFDLGGYWLAWSSAFAIIVVDIILRLLMLERPKESGNNNPSNGSHVNYQPDSENAPLLQTDRTPISPTTERTGLRFYTTLFRHRRFVGGCVSYLVFALLVSSFDTTLPLHVRAVFGWGSLPTGLLFMALQGPGIPFSPLCGWIKDRVGTCYPVAVGFLSLTPLMWLLGVPGDERFPWANGDRGPILYSVTVTMVGIMICLLNGTGTMEATMAVDEIQSKHPGIFGPNGGYSRALSISSLCWTLGTFIGPLLSGFLTEQVGYYEMGGVLAVVCLLSSINAFMNLGAEWDPVHGTD